MAVPREILDFWFGEQGAPDSAEYRSCWFETDSAFDGTIRERFLPDVELAFAGKLEKWKETPDGCLALILLLDQFSRNLFREDPRAFAADAVARDYARYALDKGFDQQFGDMHRWFFYLPFEHSEEAADQERSVELFRSLPKSEMYDIGLDYAVRHARVVKRFGRFPHRNKVLGRESTPEELEFLGTAEAPY